MTDRDKQRDKPRDMLRDKPRDMLRDIPRDMPKDIPRSNYGSVLVQFMATSLFEWHHTLFSATFVKFILSSLENGMTIFAGGR